MNIHTVTEFEGMSTPIAYYCRGHVAVDDFRTVARHDFAVNCHGAIRQAYYRNVPCNGSVMVVESSLPGRGAYPVTVCDDFSREGTAQ